MRIIFDVDNVLADSITCWCKKASEYLQTPILKDSIRSHKIVGCVPMSPEKIFELQDQVWEEWEELPPTEENLDRKINILRRNGFEICIATSRPKRSIDCVSNWLSKHRVDYDWFYSLGPSQMKTSIRADSLVDDAPEQVREFIRAGRVGFIYTQPWNAEKTIRKAIRVKNITDVLRCYRLVEDESQGLFHY